MLKRRIGWDNQQIQVRQRLTALRVCVVICGSRNKSADLYIKKVMRVYHAPI